MAPSDFDTGLQDLPDGLLGAIFVLIGPPTRRSLPAVCSRWRAVFYGEPALWRSVRLSIPYFALPVGSEQWRLGLLMRRALLQRVAAHVERATLSCVLAAECIRALYELLHLLQPSTLVGLDLQCGGWAQLGPALQRFRSGLRSLEVCRVAAAKLRPLLRALAGMPRLESLALELPPGASSAVADIAALTGLTSLALEMGPAAPPTPGGLLTAPAAAALCRMPRLARLTLIDTGTGWDAAAPAPNLALFVPRLAALPALRSYLLAMPDDGGPRRAAPGFQVDGFHLWSASYEWHSSIGADGGDELSVEVAAAPPAADLRPLLAALLPRGADLERDLAGLDVAACGKGAAGAQLPHLPRLQLLVASGFCWPGGLPRSVAQCTALLELSLVGNQLDALPLGPYLAGLTRLCLDDNAFTRVPPALTAATALRTLSLAENNRLVLGAADVHGVLLRLPGLRTLRLGDMRVWDLPETWAALEQLGSRVPHVVALYLPKRLQTSHAV